MKKTLLLLLVTSQYLLAIVSIVPVEIGSNDGLYGELTSTLETKRGNTDKDNYKAAARVTYDNNSSYVTWAEIAGEYGEANDVEDTNNIYFHLRHIQAITPEDIRGELFFQAEEDKFKLIEKRRLGGAGVRFKIFEVFEDGTGYLGLGGFYETVRYTSPVDPYEENFRINSYFAYTIGLGDDSQLSYSLYLQPKYDEIHDYIKSHKLNLQLHIYKALFLNFRVSWDVDTKPPEDVAKNDFYQETTFVLKF